MILNFPLINDFKTMNHRLFEQHGSAMCSTTNLVPRCLPPKASAKQHKKTKRTISTLSISPVLRNSITMVCLAANIFFLGRRWRELFAKTTFSLRFAIADAGFVFQSIVYKTSQDCEFFCLTKRGLVTMWRHVLVKIAIVQRESKIISP